MLDSGSHKLHNSSHFSLSCLEDSMVDSQAPREPHSVASGPRRWASTPRRRSRGGWEEALERLPQEGDAPPPRSRVR